MIADFAAQIAAEVVHVIVDDGSVLGFIVLYPRDDHVHIENVAAEKAYELGLVSKVTVPDQFEAEVRRISDRLASAAPLALRAVKEAVRSQWWDSPSRAALIEEESIQRTFRTNDAQEGIMATMEKRVPHFTGQ